MAGLVPAIHAFSVVLRQKTWMPGTSPGMTDSFRDTHLDAWRSQLD
jgi:hypothetical protein